MIFYNAAHSGSLKIGAMHEAFSLSNYLPIGECFKTGSACLLTPISVMTTLSPLEENT